MPPIGRRSWRRCGSNSAAGIKSLVGNKGYRRYLSGSDSPQPSGSMRRRSPRTPATTASGCCGPTPIWTRPRWRCSTSGCGWWSTGSARASRCSRPVRSTTGVTRRSGVMSSARSWRWCCVRNLQARLEERGHDLEWADVIGDLDRLQMVEVEQDGKRFLLRSEVAGDLWQGVPGGGSSPAADGPASPGRPLRGRDAAPGATPPD